jgi:hypothetical protein
MVGIDGSGRRFALDDGGDLPHRLQRLMLDRLRR